MTREEAIKIIKEFINGTCLHLVDQEALETLIPELKESEDEKIRKNLIELLLDTPAQDIISHHLELNKVLDYLEKQKELLESGKGLYYYDGEKAIYCGNPVTEENRRIFAMCQQEKQKEKPSIFPPGFGEVRWNPISSVQQKPSEWSEENEEEVEDLPHLVVAELGKYVGDDYWKSPWALDSTGISYPLYFAKFGAKWQREQKPEEVDEYKIIKKHITEDVISSEVNKRLKECGWYVTEEKPTEYLKAERDGWYVCIKDYYSGGKKQSSIGDLVQAKGGMHIMGEEDISEWFRRAYYEEVRDAFEPNTDTNIPEKPVEWNEDYNEENIRTRFAFYTYKDDPCTLYLSNVFVEETSRNKGFGTKILAAAEKVAETFGATYIRLKVKQNSPANAWYRKNGYGYVAFEDGYNWLEKNLEYVKPNKQEWSEEDERKYQCIRNILLTDMDKKVGSWKYSEILEWYEKRGISRYTNSKLHWKPNEEQMEALKNSAYGTYQNGDGPVLRGLYEQLEKL